MRKFYLFLFIFLINSCKDKLPSKFSREGVFLYESTIVSNNELSKIKNISSKNKDFFRLSSKYDSNNINFIYNGEYKVQEILSIGNGDFNYFFSHQRPIFYGGNFIIFIDNKGSIWKFDIKNSKSKKIFTQIKKNDFLNGSISIDDDKLYYNTNFGQLIIIDMIKEKILFNVNNNNYSFANGIIFDDKNGYASNESGNLVSINKRNGELNWIHSASAINIFGISGNESFVENSLPILNSDKIYYINKLNTFFLLNKINGESVASFSIDIQGGQIDGRTVLSFDHPIFSPFFRNNVLFFSSLSGPFNVISSENFTQLAKYPFGLNSPIVASENFAYFITDKGNLISMHLETGLIKWSRKLETFFDYKLPKYLTEGKGLRRLKLNWRGPVIINGNIVLVSPYGKMLIINSDTGEVDKEIKIPKCIFSEPIITDEKIFLYNNCFNEIVVMN